MERCGRSPASPAAWQSRGLAARLLANHPDRSAIAPPLGRSLSRDWLFWTLCHASKVCELSGDPAVYSLGSSRDSASSLQKIPGLAGTLPKPKLVSEGFKWPQALAPGLFPFSVEPSNQKVLLKGVSGKVKIDMKFHPNCYLTPSWLFMSIREKNQMVSVLARPPLFISATQRRDPQSLRKYCIMIFLLLK